MSFHNTEVLSSLHTIYFRAYANATTRLGDGTLQSADIGKVALQSDTNQYYVLQNNSPVTWASITGSGAGSGGINYISQNDSDATDSVGDWIAYADADAVPLSKPGGATPGTGGSPTITITRSTVLPLRNTASFLVTKTAVNSQGQGVSVPFAIDSADQGKILTVSCDYQPGAGFVAGSDTIDSDIEGYIYDVTNNVVTPLSPYKLGTAATFIGSYGATFQAASNSVSYRLILHIATVNASAWTFKFDNVRVGPGAFAIASIATDWTAFPMVITGSVTNPTKGTSAYDVALWRRIGDSMEIIYTFRGNGAGTIGSGDYKFAIPVGYVIDGNKVRIDSAQNAGVVGSAAAGTNLSNYAGIVKVYTSTHLSLEVLNDTASKTNVGSTLAPLSDTNPLYSFRAVVPIAGWSSNVTLANLATSDASPVACAYKSIANQSIANGATPISLIFGSKIFDTRGAFDGVSTFTVPVPGKYLIQAEAVWGASENWTDSYQRLFVYKNGSVYLPVDVFSPHQVYTGIRLGANKCGLVMDLNAGDAITLRVQHDQVTPRTVTSNGITADETWICITRTGDSSLIVPVDPQNVVASYSTAVGQNLTSGSYQIIDFGTMIRDSIGAVTTGASWKFTAATPGSYLVSATITFASVAWAAGNYGEAMIHKNGSIYRSSITRVDSSTANYVCITVTTQIDLLAGDFIDVRGFQTSAGARALFTDAHYNYITVVRQGN